MTLQPIYRLYQCHLSVRSNHLQLLVQQLIHANKDNKTKGSALLPIVRNPLVTGAWWCHQMETFSALLAFCAGNSPVPGEFPTQRPVTHSFDNFFDLAWINGWVNNREAGDLRRYRVHYDVIVMGFSSYVGSVSMSWCIHVKIYSIIILLLNGSIYINI